MRMLRSSIAFLVLLAFAHDSFAAAQLASGAKTSAKPTSTNPQIRQMQITFDPDLVPLGQDANPNVGNYAVTSFQLSVQYDPNVVAFKSLTYVAPYQQTAGTNFNNDPAAGLISTIAGQAPIAAVAGTAGQDVNIFSILFTLNNGVDFNTPLQFTIFGQLGGSDFITGTDPSDNSTLTSQNTQANPNAIEPTTINESYNQMIAETSPEPASLALLALAIPLLARLRGRS